MSAGPRFHSGLKHSFEVFDRIEGDAVVTLVLPPRSSKVALFKPIRPGIPRFERGDEPLGSPTISVRDLFRWAIPSSGGLASGTTMGAAVPKVTWEQALAWRMERHLLDPVGRLPVEDVVRQLCAVQTQVPSSAELAVRVRRQRSRAGEVGRALSQGRLIKTWAMRGALHLLRPEDAGSYLSLLAAGRSWERPSWQRYFGVTPKTMELLRRAVREALDGATLTREEIADAVRTRRGLEHIGTELRSSWGTLLKPIAWQGDLCCGPSRGNRATFMLPEAASDSWGGIPDPEDAAPAAIVGYVGAYGPATFEAFGLWLAGGYFGTRKLRTWFEGLGDRLAEVDVEGDRAYVLAEDVDEIASTKASTAVRLLPGFDPYILGPGTADSHVVPAARRKAVSKQAGWIAPVVVTDGSVRGIWELDGDRTRIAWFREGAAPPKRELQHEVERLSGMLGRDLRLQIRMA